MATWVWRSLTSWLARGRRRRPRDISRAPTPAATVVESAFAHGGTYEFSISGSRYLAPANTEHVGTSGPPYLLHGPLSPRVLEEPEADLADSPLCLAPFNAWGLRPS